MAQSFTLPSKKAGLPPGSLIHVGSTPAQLGRITLTVYTNDHCEDLPVHSLEEILQHRGNGNTLWVQCEGLDIFDMVESLGRELQVHPLVLEDILNTHQRPKFEEYENCLFFVVKTLRCTPELIVEHEQISLLLFSDMVFTFREQTDELFSGLKLRLNASKGRIRCLGTDYLTYAIIDLVVDNYFVLTDTLEDSIENIELELLAQPQAHLFTTIQMLKRELVFIRKAITPIREVLLAIQRSESPLIQQRTQPYFRDVFDHSLRVIDIMDSYRDLINGMLDIYLSSVSNRMNEIMKVMTVFATIFIPLTFLVGVYGMNFDYMPELHWKWAYPILWGLFFCIPAGLITLFKKKRWL
ncbi:MAG: magnesium/cobalt transporter CorA [Desulfobulbus sp.]|nr:magnesium/cobalt transporter CorA [Desulfobulbus sp.]